MSRNRIVAHGLHTIKAEKEHIQVVVGVLALMMGGMVGLALCDVADAARAANRVRLEIVNSSSQGTPGERSGRSL